MLKFRLWYSAIRNEIGISELRFGFGAGFRKFVKFNVVTITGFFEQIVYQIIK